MTDQKLAPGDEAPDFSLPDADGKTVSLSALRGQRVIVYFYPAAMTPGCTKEACDFRDNLGALGRAGLTVLGISQDSPAKLSKFRDKESLNFTLLADPDREVHAGLRGLWREDDVWQEDDRRDPVHVRDRRGRHRGDGRTTTSRRPATWSGCART